jgi:uncharacterized protein YbjT (DUF2867 family)
VILVAGGTGTLGRHVVSLLVDRGVEVRILARNAARAPSIAGSRLQFVAGDVRDPSAVERAVAGAQTVVSAITGFGPARDVSPRTVDWEGNANLIRAARAAGVEHFILTSVYHAAPNHPMELHRMKHRAEQELEDSGVAWTVIRPTSYMETWLGVLGAPLLQTGKTRIFGRGKNPINFVSARDIARLVDLALAEPTMRGAAVDAGGHQNLSMDELLESFRRVTGARGKVSHVPLPMMRLMSVLMKPFNRAMAGLIQAGVVMDTTDMTFDPDEIRTRYPSISPTSLAEVIRIDYAKVPS